MKFKTPGTFTHNSLVIGIGHSFEWEFEESDTQLQPSLSDCQLDRPLPFSLRLSLQASGFATGSDCSRQVRST